MSDWWHAVLIVSAPKAQAPFSQDASASAWALKIRLVRAAEQSAPNPQMLPVFCHGATAGQKQAAVAGWAAAKPTKRTNPNKIRQHACFTVKPLSAAPLERHRETPGGPLGCTPKVFRAPLWGYLRALQALRFRFAQVLGRNAEKWDERFRAGARRGWQGAGGFVRTPPA